MAFRDRKDAGRQLSQALESYRQEDCIILGLARGGVVIAFEVAKALNQPLDVMVVRKLGAPTHQELAIGAIAPNEVMVLNEHLIRALDVQDAELQNIVRRETAELKRRLHFYRGNRTFPELQNKTVILIDDGLATGASAIAAIRATRSMNARHIILAVPVGAHSTVTDLRREVDELICLEAPEFFDAVSRWYVDFPQVSDTEVIRLLEAAWGNDLGDMTVKARTIGPP